MPLSTATFGGLLLMTGNHSRSESLFYYFRLEDQVPEKSSATPVDHHINFDFVRATAVSNSSGGKSQRHQRRTNPISEMDFRFAISAMAA